MGRIQELRQNLTDAQRGLIDEIWNHFIKTNEWPTTWDFHAPHRKAFVIKTLSPLSASILFVAPDAQHDGRYQLSLLGALLTYDGPSLEDLLLRYFEFMRQRYRTRREDKVIQALQVQKFFEFSDEQTKLLGRIVILGNIFSGSAGYDSKWEKTDWSATILKQVEDFPPEGSLNEEVENFAFAHYNPKKRVLGQEPDNQSGPIQHMQEMEIAMNESEADPRTVFVVHGRNEQLRKALFEFLRTIGLRPLEWSQAVSATGEASPYIGTILEKAFSVAQAVVVLMTPDDTACLMKEFQTEHDPDFEKNPTGQARPNVLFEAGMAMGRNPTRTVLVQIGEIRPFSDIVGRHVLHLNDTTQRRQDLADRLKAAGCAVDITGRDWHTAGSFFLNRPNADFAKSGTAKHVVEPSEPKMAAGAEKQEPELSEQALMIIRGFVSSKADSFFYADWGNGQWTLQLSGGPQHGEQIGIIESNFLHEDINQLIKLKLISAEQNDDGHLICRPTRKAFDLFDRPS